MQKPRLIQTFLPDGTLEGVRIIEVSQSEVKALVVPRIKLNDVKARTEATQPALYLLINSGDNQVYIGQSENFFNRLKNHDQAKDFWDVAVAIVSNTNALEKSDVTYLESLAVERAKASAAMEVLNSTTPQRNHVHEFKLHTLQAILDDTALIAELLGFSVFEARPQTAADTWFCETKKTTARAQFRGDKFVVLAGSVIDKTYAPSWVRDWPKPLAEREELFAKYGRDLGETVELTENIPFRSPNHAGGFITGRNVNAWRTFRDGSGRTMDEVVRRGINHE